MMKVCGVLDALLSTGYSSENGYAAFEQEVRELGLTADLSDFYSERIDLSRARPVVIRFLMEFDKEGGDCGIGEVAHYTHDGLMLTRFRWEVRGSCVTLRERP